jgi:hypothetical protein
MSNQQRFHGRRASAMRMGLRGLLFTVNPKQEPKAVREISQLIEKVLDEMPAEAFRLSAEAQQQQKKSADDPIDNQHLHLGQPRRGSEVPRLRGSEVPRQPTPPSPRCATRARRRCCFRSSVSSRSRISRAT